jgi:hypothetical protein
VAEAVGTSGGDAPRLVKGIGQVLGKLGDDKDMAQVNGLEYRGAYLISYII